MKSLLYKSIISATALLLAQCADFIPSVPRGQAYFYQHAGYKGNMLQMDANGRSDFFLREHGWNDDVSSFKIGEGIIVQLCQHKYCEGSDRWENLVEIIGPYNVGYLNNWMNDFSSHIRIKPYDSVNDPRVQVFSGEQFNIGRAGTFKPGEYISEDMKNHHIDKGGYWGSITSMVIPSGLYAQIFKDDYFRGESIILEGPQEVDFIFGSIKGWDDQVRSLKIGTTEQLRVRCFWQSVISGNGPLSQQIEIGITQTDGSVTEKTIRNDFTTAVTVGYSYGGFSASTTLSHTISSQIREEISSTLERSEKVTQVVTCPNDKQELVSLYQWKLKGTKRGETLVSLSDSHYICRYGVNANSGPACPLTQCADSQCTQCVSQMFLQ